MSVTWQSNRTSLKITHAGVIQASTIGQVLMALACLLLSPTAKAITDSGTEPHDHILEAARSYLAEQIGSELPSSRIQIGKLDSRLKLSACNSPLEAFSPPGTRRAGGTTVGVRCPGEKPWTVYVTGKISIYKTVIVTKRPLIRGQIISLDDVMTAERDIAEAVHGYASETAATIGKTLKQSVPVNSILAPTLLDTPPLVKRGQSVTILAAGTAMEIRMSGTVLMDGAAGDLVRVRNQTSKRIVEATVMESGVVRVGM